MSIQSKLQIPINFSILRAQIENFIFKTQTYFNAQKLCLHQFIKFNKHILNFADFVVSFCMAEQRYAFQRYSL